MTTSTRKLPVASFEKTLEFCNKLRKAGGGATLDALMPAIPEDSNQCLLARNMNFDCEVNTTASGDWYIELSDFDVAEKIAIELKLKRSYDPKDDWDRSGDVFRLFLPKTIGRVAHEFDQIWDLYGTRLNSAYEVWYEYEREFYPNFSNYAKAHCKLSSSNLKELSKWWPYIDASIFEAQELASAFNEKGQLIL